MRIGNAEIGRTLRELATRLGEQGATFRARGLVKASQSIEDLSRPVEELWRAGGIPALSALPWVGVCTARWLVELINSGQIAELEMLRRVRFLKQP